MAQYAIVIQALLLSLVAAIASAQLATNITTPAYNGTIKAGEKIAIEYNYGNIGTGNYSVDIALWQDASATELIQNVTTGQTIEGGNSTGYQLNYTYPGAYDWTVPKSLTITTKDANGKDTQSTPEIIYLTVTTQAETVIMGTIRARSRPILLHYSAGTVVAPSIVFVLLAVASVFLCHF